MVGSQELLRLASRDLILGNTTPEEQISFVEEQIRNPFDSGSTNYFRQVSKTVTSQDELDEICQRFITQIQDVYDHLTVDLSEYDQHLAPFFMAFYKFFVKNVSKLMYIFIRAFIYNNKNRKGLIGTFMNQKIPSYPKEQFGKKEFYILITKLNAIVDEIFEGSDIKLKKFIEFIEKSDDTAVYVVRIKEALELGIISDNGVVDDMYRLYKKSDNFRSDMNRLEMDITNTFIIPYLEETGMIKVRIPPTEEIPVEADDEEGDEDGEN